jgi:hypothetical protein
VADPESVTKINFDTKSFCNELVILLRGNRLSRCEKPEKYFSGFSLFLDEKRGSFNWPL